MRLPPLHCLLPLLALMAMDSPAATLFRCEAADGRIGFHQHGCPPGQAQSRQRAHNPKIPLDSMRERWIAPVFPGLWRW